MRLLLSLHEANSEPRDVQVVADGRATVGDVARALAATGGETVAVHKPSSPSGSGKSAGDASLHTLRIEPSKAEEGRDLHPGHTIEEAGLTSGASVSLTPWTRNAADTAQTLAPAMLHITSGSGAGTVVALSRGKHTVGRSSTCDITLDDPRVSSVHATLDVTHQVHVADNSSSNGTRVNGARVDASFVTASDILECGDTTMKVVLSGHGHRVVRDTGNISCLRNPTVVVRPRQQKMTLDTPPAPTAQQPLSWIALAIPVVMGAVLVAVTRNPMMALFLVMSPIMMLLSHVDRKRLAAKEGRRARISHSAHVADMKARVVAAQEKERAALRTAHPTAHECVTAATQSTLPIWRRRREHPEFLTVRVGDGPVASRNVLEPGTGSSEAYPDMVALNRSVCDEMAVLKKAPVVVDLAECGNLAIVGNSDAASALQRAVLMQLVSTHSPTDLVVSALVGPTRVRAWEWLKWLPHTVSESSPISVPHCVSAKHLVEATLVALESLVNTRKGDAPLSLRGPLGEQSDSGAGAESSAPFAPAVVVVVDDPEVDISRLATLAEHGPDVGVFTLWTKRTLEDVPGACRSFVAPADDGGLHLHQVRHESTTPIAADALGASDAEAAARTLSAVADGSLAVQTTSDIPSLYTLIECLSEHTNTTAERLDETVASAWYSAVSARIGDATGLPAAVGHDGTKPVVVDLVHDGPHAMVGGTTGAGKSEFLRSWVLSMAATYSPSLVNFLFVDYKGGSAFAQCVDLPHSVGMVTDLSPGLVDRALVSLRAEITYREELLRAHRMQDISEFKRSGSSHCPPSLLIIVDEFAALVAEVPEFIDGVVDVAQRGRSLGLHLILATQRPSGVIKDNLRANTNLRIALRMADAADSKEIVGTETAAHLPPSRRGRVVLRSGPGLLTTFQSAYASGVTGPARAVDVTVKDHTLESCAVWPQEDTDTALGGFDSDIVRVVDAAQSVAAAQSLPAPRKPWLPELSNRYDSFEAHVGLGTCVLGMADKPASQTQEWQRYDLDSDGHVLVTGASGSGKTVALLSWAGAMVLQDSGNAELYVMDCTGGSLGATSALPCTSAVALGQELGRATQIVERIAHIVDERSAMLSVSGASGLDAVREFDPDAARVVLIVDNVGRIKQWGDEGPHWGHVRKTLASILERGRSVGVTVLASTVRWAEVPPDMLAALTTRVVLNPADMNDGSVIALPRGTFQDPLEPGRGVLFPDATTLHVATPSAATTSAELVNVLAETMAERAVAEVPRLSHVPAVVEAADVPALASNSTGELLVGVSVPDGAPMTTAVAGTLLVSGGPGAGKRSTMRWLAHACAMANIPVLHVVGKDHPAADRPSYHVIPGAAQQLAGREQELTESILAPTKGRPTALFVHKTVDAFSRDVFNRALDSACLRILDGGGLVVLSDDISKVNQYADTITLAKNSARAIMLRCKTHETSSYLRVNTPPLRPFDDIPGRGLMLEGGTSRIIHIPWLPSDIM